MKNGFFFFDIEMKNGYKLRDTLFKLYFFFNLALHCLNTGPHSLYKLFL